MGAAWCITFPTQAFHHSTLVLFTHFPYRVTILGVDKFSKFLDQSFECLRTFTRSVETIS